MAIRKVPFVVGEYYHVYNRGVDKRIIFLDERDYERFMMLLYLCNSTKPVRVHNYLKQGKPLLEIFSVDRGEQLVDIGAYVLIPNHLHIFIHERVEGGASMFMEKLLTAYSMYFNKKYERTGALFEGKFKAKHIDSQSYFNWVFSYIHLNVVKLIDSNWKKKGISNPEKARKFMKKYKYSSYFDYFLGDRPEGAILNKGAFPEHFAQMNDFNDLLQEFSVDEQ